MAWINPRVRVFLYSTPLSLFSYEILAWIWGFLDLELLSLIWLELEVDFDEFDLLPLLPNRLRQDLYVLMLSILCI